MNLHYFHNSSVRLGGSDLGHLAWGWMVLCGLFYVSENGLRVVRGDGMTWPRTAHRPSGYLRLIHMLEVAAIPTGSKRWKASGHFSDLSLHHICCCPIGQSQYLFQA